MGIETRMRGHERVASALATVAAGEAVVLIDREGRGALAFAAAGASTAGLAFTVRHTSGFVRVALRAQACGRLDLPPMHRGDEAGRVTVDLDGHGTGISAADRAATIAALADPDSRPEQFTRPGHVVPVLAREGGVLAEPGSAEAAVDLAELAGSPPAGAFCELVSTEDPLEIAGAEEAARFATTHRLALLWVHDLLCYRRRYSPGIRRVGSSEMTTAFGLFGHVSYTTPADDTAHVAVLAAAPDGDADVPFYLRRACLAREALGVQACSCGRDAESALKAITDEGRGIVLHLRSATPPPRCSDQTIEDLEADVHTAAAILADLGVLSVRLVPQDPVTAAGLTACGVTVASGGALSLSTTFVSA